MGREAAAATSLTAPGWRFRGDVLRFLGEEGEAGKQTTTAERTRLPSTRSLGAPFFHRSVLLSLSCTETPECCFFLFNEDKRVVPENL